MLLYYVCVPTQDIDQTIMQRGRSPIMTLWSKVEPRPFSLPSTARARRTLSFRLVYHPNTTVFITGTIFRNWKLQVTSDQAAPSPITWSQCHLFHNWRHLPSSLRLSAAFDASATLREPIGLDFRNTHFTRP